MAEYDYLIVGAGLYGSSFACLAHRHGKRCLVIDKRPHLGGNVYCKEMEGINVHYYGAHIFHTSSREVWDFVNELVPFNRYTNSPIANYRGQLYNLPFNMNTFHLMWGVRTPEEARAVISQQRQAVEERMRREGIAQPRNLEEQALLLVGQDIYERLIKDYTEKQWGRRCTELPAFIIKRLPVRMTFDNNYFNDRHKITVGGQFCADENSRKFFDRLRVRAGVSYATPYLKINGNDGPKEFGASLGFGIPIINSLNNRSILNISGQWVQQSGSGLIKENTFRINLGLTFNERWFMKWKVE